MYGPMLTSILCACVHSCICVLLSVCPPVQVCACVLCPWYGWVRVCAFTWVLCEVCAFTWVLCGVCAFVWVMCGCTCLGVFNLEPFFTKNIDQTSLWRLHNITQSKKFTNSCIANPLGHINAIKNVPKSGSFKCDCFIIVPCQKNGNDVVKNWLFLCQTWTD